MTVELIRSIKKVEEVRFEQTFECLSVVGCSDELGDRVPDESSIAEFGPCSWYGVVESEYGESYLSALRWCIIMINCYINTSDFTSQAQQ